MNTVQLRRLAEVNPATPEFDRIPDAGEVTFTPLEAIWPDGNADFSRRRPKADVAVGYTRYRTGDVLVPKVTPTFEAARTAVAQVSTAAAAGSTELHVVRARPGADARFLSYVMRSQPFLQEGRAAFQGVAGLQRITDSFLREFPVPTRTPEEQRRIADYLDAETAHIGALIEKKKRQVALIKEAAATEQGELACRGLEPSRTQDSGQPWLRDVPESWRVVRLKFVARMESGHTPARTRPELWENCVIPWVTLNDVGYLESHEYIESTINLISEAGIAASSARVLPEGTVVLSRDATVGRCAILATKMATSQHFVDWICGPDLRPRYLWLLFRTSMQSLFGSFNNGATLRTIGMPDINRFAIPLPSLIEQDQIVARAEAVRVRAERLITALQRQMAILGERRQALITAAVTGELEIEGPQHEA